ncbi:MAG: hypothetical protein IPG44_04035 [Anaerolineales bacterium]|nr:hypothetical protein [Chloroflexota bacterium]MBK6644915.1 hypothetical protein [Anaerolineales bacterium]MCC6986955.1 hypothetical protein [Anaerolineales bacterium]
MQSKHVRRGAENRETLRQAQGRFLQSKLTTFGLHTVYPLDENPASFLV